MAVNTIAESILVITKFCKIQWRLLNEKFHDDFMLEISECLLNNS
jgi:hypothetical protein